MPNEVFLSHSNANRSFVDDLADVLRPHGIPFWYSDINIVGAQMWHDEIAAALVSIPFLITPDAPMQISPPLASGDEPVHVSMPPSFLGRPRFLFGGGSAWITNVADELLAGMRKTCILDVYHALEYASAALKALAGDSGGHKARLAGVKARLLDGQVAGVIADLEPHRGRHKDAARRIDCFESNKSRMRYDEYRARGMQIGSGKVESRCRQTVASRFKTSGCKWSVRGADALLALKSCWTNLQWEAFAHWKAQRIAAA